MQQGRGIERLSLLFPCVGTTGTAALSAPKRKLLEECGTSA